GCGGGHPGAGTADSGGGPASIVDRSPAATTTGSRLIPDESKLVDLTWSFDEETIYWPNAAGFRHRKDVWAQTEGGDWYAAGGFSTDEHGGTHLDSPIHFAEGRRTLDAIPIAQLV